MPNLRSAKKRLRQDQKRYDRNRAAKSRFRTALKKVNAAIEAGNVDAVKATLPEALSLIGKTAKQGSIHKNKAARQESRLVKKANALLGGSATAPAEGGA